MMMGAQKLKKQTSRHGDRTMSQGCRRQIVRI